MNRHDDAVMNERQPRAPGAEAAATNPPDAIAQQGVDKAGGLRAGVEQSLGRAKNRLLDYQRAASAKSAAAARATDRYVRVNPWQALGVAAGIGIVAGALLGLLLRRR